MAKNNKPKKYHRGKVIAGGHLPLPAEKAKKMETQALMALAALREGFFGQDMGLDLSIFLTSFEKMPLSDEEIDRYHIPAMKALASIADRHTRSGRWGASGDDLRVLDETLPWLASKWVSFPRGLVAAAESRAEQIYLKVFDKR